MEKKEKFLLFLLFLAALIVGGEFIYYNSVKNKILQGRKEESVIQKEVSPTPKKLSYLEIAKKTLDCLDKTMRDEKGVYVLGKECSSANDCQKTLTDNRVGLYVLWGRAKYVQKTDDQKEKETLIKDINLYLDKEKVPVIQPDFRSKILLYEIWKSGFLNDEEKQKIIDLEKKVDPGMPSNVRETLQSIKENNYKEPHFLDFTESLKAILSAEQESDVSVEDFRKNILFSSDYFFKYVWGKEADYLKVAKTLLYDSLNEYFILNNELNTTDKCLLGLNLVDFYKELKEKSFLDLSLNIFEEGKIGDECWLKGSCSGDVLFHSVCGQFARELGHFAQGERYTKLSRDYFNFLINNNFDNQGYGGYSAGDGCFYSRSGLDSRLRTTTENGLIVGILSED